VIDHAAAIERLGGDEELFAELVGLFREEGPRMIREIRQAIADGDPTGIQRTSHGLKGAVGYLGGTRATEAAQRLELIGASKDLFSAPGAFLHLEEEIERLLSAFEAASRQTAGA
jgi:two-component system sensor histidine kinase/response regulator